LESSFRGIPSALQKTQKTFPDLATWLKVTTGNSMDCLQLDVGTEIMPTMSKFIKKAGLTV
jgi:hypothetical protein